ncbi:MAG: hypothetical protein OSB00_15735 [Sphingomonas bacterium]|nr:hypothetical protein [Sphingomonas bacterium]
MRLTLSLITLCLLAACGDGPAANRNENIVNASVPGALRPPAIPDTATLDTATPWASNDSPSVIAPTTPARDGTDPAAAVATVEAYYRAIDAHDYRTAYRLWGDDGKASNQSFDAFARGFAHTRSATVTTGKPGNSEGAAGSIYITIPVTVSAVTDRGEQQRYTGNYDLRRINGVDGATPAQLRWHIASASLKKTE